MEYMFWVSGWAKDSLLGNIVLWILEGVGPRKTHMIEQSNMRYGQCLGLVEM